MQILPGNGESNSHTKRGSTFIPIRGNSAMTSAAVGPIAIPQIEPANFPNLLIGARRDTLAVMKLSFELAMALPNRPMLAAEKIRAIDSLARERRLRLEVK